MKYRALIVDDETIILNGILRLPVWLSLDIEPVPAMTGVQALKLMDEYRFDMVITDIRMPEMDGLEFICRLRKVKPELPVVILSGYDSFAYAKEAIHYGIEDYLVKPVSQLDLSDAVTRIVCGIEEKRESRMQEEMLRGTMKQTVYDARAQQFEKCLLGGEMEDQLERTLGSHFVLAECIPRMEDENETLGGLNLLLESLRDIAFKQGRGKGAVVTLFMGYVVFAVNQGLTDFKRILAELKEWSTELEFPCAMAYLPVEEGESLGKKYQDLTEIFAYRFYHDGFCALTAQDTRAGDGGPCFEVIEAAVKAGDTEGACRELDKVIEELRRDNRPPEETRRYCMHLYLLLAQYTDGQIRETGIAKLLMGRERTAFSGLAAMLRQLLAHWELDKSEEKLPNFSKTVRTAVDYIHEHLDDEELSISGVAGKVLFLHPDYFGKLFKKETGISFTRYVMGLRMDKAKQMIAQKPDIKVYELCEATGFGDNPHYFSQVFRSCCGCTPSEYKRAMREDGRPEEGGTE